MMEKSHLLKAVAIASVLILENITFASGSTFLPEDTLTTELAVSFSNDNDVNTCLFTIEPAPDSITSHMTYKELDYYEPSKKGIIFGFDGNTPIPDGKIFTLHYNNLIKNTTVVITQLNSADAAAQYVTVEGGQATISLFFSSDDVVATVFAALGKDTTNLPGVVYDMDKNNEIDATDIQAVINKRST